MHQDLNNTLEDFLFLKKSILEEQERNSELRATIENLQKQNKDINDILKLEGRQHSIEQETVVIQQKTNALILELKGENLKLNKHVKDLEVIISDLKMEKMKLEKHYSDLKLSCSKQLEDMKMNYENKIREIEQELNTQLLELNKKLEEGAHHKRDEINMLILEYEEKLQKLEHCLIAKENENADIQKKATADVAIYQKKMLALEHLCNELQIQRQEVIHHSSGSMIRHHQQLSTSASVNDQISSAEQGFQYHPSSKFHPSSSPRSSTAFLCSPTDFQPDTTSITPIQNKQPKGRSRPSISKRNISEVSSTVTVSKVGPDTANVMQETGALPKATRFSMAKKRKLFSNNQNTL